MLDSESLGTWLPQLGFAVVFLVMLSKVVGYFTQVVKEKDAAIKDLNDKLLVAFKENALALSNNTKAVESLEKTINGKK